jgi:hypothetical protein
MSEISGSRTLHRLIYASHQEIPPADIDFEVSNIIRSAMRRNRELSITGLLLVHEGYFLQALEGPAEAVMTTYGRICADTRHSEPQVIQAGPSPARLFGDWNMCARRMTPADEAILDAIGQKTQFEPRKLSEPSALRLLRTVRGIQHRTQLAGLG